MSGFVTAPGPGETPPASEIGGKAHNLARLAGIAGVHVPPWLVIDVHAFDAFVLDGADPASGMEHVRARVAELPLPSRLADALRPVLAARGLFGTVAAVRSSATAEDADAASFAGQFTSVLGVPVEHDLHEVWRAIKTVWLSAFSEHALAYSSAQSAANRLRMAVIVQQLAPARAAGVAFSIDPVSGDRDVAVVSAVYGLGESLVSGDVDADTMRVTRDGRIGAVLADKEHAVLRAPRGAGADGSGTIRVEVPTALRRAPAISDAQTRAIATVARTLEESLGAPQDVEWAIGTTDAYEISGPTAGETLYVLQARPITAAGERATGERRVWDNSNIVESYSGVTTPLTFSFARGVYEQVYRQFCELLGVRAAVIDAHRDVFANMLGLISGRVYYNLLSWYRVLGLLPGYAWNREFMERMMGVRERLTEPPAPGAGERTRDAGRLLRSVGRLWQEHGRLERESTAFFARVNQSLGPVEQVDLDAWSADDLAALYRRLESELLMHWRAPLVNDFFAMIWFGVLGRLVERWLPDAEPTLVNDLLVGEGGIVSTEPARRITSLAAMVVGTPALHDEFRAQPDDDALLRQLRADARHPEFLAAFDAYLARFGDRCVGELKLETITPSEDPGFVIRMTRAYLARQADPARDTTHEATVRARAESVVRGRLHGARRRTFFLVLRNARARIRDRENLRFERTRVFGVVRRIFRGLGHRLHDLGRLEHHRDVFYLTVEEIFAAIAGTGVTGDLRPLAALRRAEFARWEQDPAPPDRFETRGPPAAPAPMVAGDATAGAGDLQGLGCCPGVVRCPVRVVRDPSRAGDLQGHILVAERTDPGWTLLFPIASGLLVQRGSLLSHSAIVAREVGLPCIVAIPGLMDALTDGEVVEMNGATGIVRRIAAPGPRA